MPKALCITGLAVSAILFLIFLSDLAIAAPFKRANLIMDIAFVLCSAGLGFLSWLTWKEQV
ncbi:MAG: hypothetical protein MUE50_00355 [Pirellulaceae bacterium]|jgi:hypothetical protein|nr:hypothetical protein [Pirellulaceae bacterium]MCU0980765.1 hypothetical protein [Pirellulaceae bacterium]